jgi:hypothetical protein
VVSENFNFNPEEILNTHRIQETLFLNADRKAIVLEGDIIAVCALDLFPVPFFWIL